MAETSDAGAQRDRSTIKFPYGDLEDAIDVANTVHEHFGLSCTIDQVAAALGHSMSGAFRGKMATASTFGVVETGRGEVHLTELGQRIADPKTGPAARVDAFLSVPLYQAVFERFRGSRLPGDAGLEAELVRFGVAPKAAAKARQTLVRSADQAGFFSLGRDRLVQPSVGTIAPVQSAPPASDPAPTPTPVVNGVGSVPPGLPQHPLLVGLWQELPAPGDGTFSSARQGEWLEAAKVVLKLLYGGAGVTSSHVQTSAAAETGIDA